MRFRRILLCIGLASLLGVAPLADAQTHSFGVDDMLKMEGFGAAMIDPSSRWLVYEQVRPYDRFTDYSFRTYAFGRSGHQLWRYDLARGGAPERLPGLDPAPHAYLQAFSPSGQRLAFMQYDKGHLSLGAYDMDAQRVVVAERTPAFSRTGDHNPVWISDCELVFAALPEGMEPEATSVRAHTGRVLSEAWQHAWAGDRVTAVEVRTRADPSDDGAAPGELVVFNACTGEDRVLAHGLFADLRLSPDHHQLAALAVSRPRPLEPDKPMAGDVQSHGLTVFDLASGAIRRIAPDLTFMPYTIAWRPDGQALAAFGWPPQADPHSGRFQLVDLANGRVTPLDHVGLDLVSERERGWLQRPERAVFLGDGLLVFARPIPEGEDTSPRFTFRPIRPEGLVRPDWFVLGPGEPPHNATQGLAGISAMPLHAGPDSVTIAASDGAYTIRRDGTRVRETPALAGAFSFVAPGTFATRSGVLRSELSDDIIFSVRTASGTSAGAVTFTGTGAARVVMAPGTLPAGAVLTGSVAANALLLRTEGEPVSRLLALSLTAERPSTEIARINTHLEAVAFGAWQTMEYAVPDPEGLLPTRTVQSCVLLPADYTPGRSLPVIVDVYPGTRPHCPQGHEDLTYPDPHSPYIWAGLGYAYTSLATPGDLLRTPEGPIAGLDEVIGAGLDALISAGIADPDRIVLHGYSQGGVSALYVAAQSDRYRAVIAKNSWADLFSHYFGSEGIYAYEDDAFGAFQRYDSLTSGDFGLGVTPFEDPALYYRNSPVFLAPDIKAPVLLIHSDMDSFAMQQFDEMFGALRRAGKDARYVRYWGEGHGPSSPANIRDMWDRMEGFLIATGAAP